MKKTFDKTVKLRLLPLDMTAIPAKISISIGSIITSLRPGHGVTA